ncbi:MAG: ribosomal-processing cysteine protease Prp [Oscillospiraceae bacterium]|nr:ribosomal-processing cysteine protease Prp [Oscillospiraceae bacterium]
MTKIRIERRAGRMRIAACGHAVGSAAACAGISALFYALYGYLREDDGATIYCCRLASGDALLEFSGGASAAAAYEMAAVGLRQIARGYPACVTVKE